MPVSSIWDIPSVEKDGSGGGGGGAGGYSECFWLRLRRVVPSHGGALWPHPRARCLRCARSGYWRAQACERMERGDLP